jgi:uncharacterized protein (TIGR03083 family)
MDAGADFLAVARVAAKLLREPAVAKAWAEPSALPEFSVAGLAGHLAFQVLAIPDILRQPVPTEPLIPLLEHYSRVRWVDADLDDEINVRIRQGGDQEAAAGPEALTSRMDAAIAELDDTLSTVDNRPVRISLWGPWSLRLDHMLITRMMELAVHADDLAVSVGLPTPELPVTATDTVIDLLAKLATRRHGPTAIIRALSRKERAPLTIAAF